MRLSRTGTCGVSRAGPGRIRDPLSPHAAAWESGRDPQATGKAPMQAIRAASIFFFLGNIPGFGALSSWKDMFERRKVAGITAGPSHRICS